MLEGPSLLFFEKPQKLIILLHGYGDNAENFILLTKYFNDNNLKANYFAPNAPSSLAEYPSGRQWFNPYPNGIHYNEVGQNEKAIMEQECKTSTRMLEEYINKLLSLNNLSYQDCFLIGFSQGAMIAFELGNFMKKKFAGCTMLSGRILSDYNFNNNMFINTPLLIIHGDKDEVVNPKYFAEACKITKSYGFTVEKHLMKDEGHTISPQTLQITQNFIKKYV